MKKKACLSTFCKSENVSCWLSNESCLKNRGGLLAHCEVVNGRCSWACGTASFFLYESTVHQQIITGVSSCQACSETALNQTCEREELLFHYKMSLQSGWFPQVSIVTRTSRRAPEFSERLMPSPVPCSHSPLRYRTSIAVNHSISTNQKLPLMPLLFSAGVNDSCQAQTGLYKTNDHTTFRF